MATSRKRNQGGKNWLLNGIWFILIGGAVIGFFNVPSDPTVSNLADSAISKSETLKSWFQNCIPGIVENGTTSQCALTPANPNAPVPTPPAENPPLTEVSAGLENLPVKSAENVDYDRDEWNHWVRQGASCWDTRDQVLYDEAVKDATLVLWNGDKKPVTDVASACSVNAGTWLDPYTGETITDPKALDIDHMIPLNYAAQHGGNSWASDFKQQYANDLSNPQHLLAVKAGENRSKSDKGPSEWKPKNKNYWCQYATDWVTISQNYGLSTAEADKTALREMLETC